MKEKSHQKETRDKEFAEYEKQYLEEIEKTNLTKKKLKRRKQQKKMQHEARIARRLELKKHLGKIMRNYYRKIENLNLNLNQTQT